MIVPVSVRIGIIIAGFGLLFAAEYVDIVRTRRSAAPRSGAVERALRIAGALCVLAGLIVWLIPSVAVADGGARLQRFALLDGF